MDDNWAAIVGLLCVFGLPLGAIIVSRVLAHRERMEMIRHGMLPPLGKGGQARYSAPSTPVGPADMHVATPADAGRLLGRGIQLAFIGMALTIGLAFIGYHPADLIRPAVFNFGPWLLGGLIPLFIGLSQVTIAFLTDPQIFARYRGAPPHEGGPSHGSYQGPFYGQTGSARPEPGDGNDPSYTYRPGGTQELRPPTPPPRRP